MTIYLIRHGKDDDTVRGGWSDHGLSTVGVKQVYALAKNMAAANMAFDRIYSSDLQRAVETAEILSNYLKCPIEYDIGLRESDNGDLAGMKNDAASEKFPGLYWSALAYDQCYPNGESPEMFYHRVKAAWLELKDKLKRASKDTLVVTHGGVIEVILCIENGIAYSNKVRRFSTPNAQLIPIKINRPDA